MVALAPAAVVDFTDRASGAVSRAPRPSAPPSDLVRVLRAVFEAMRTHRSRAERLAWLRSADAQVAYAPAELGRLVWREIRTEPPADRLKFLKSQDGITALGAKQCATMLKALDRDDRRMTRQACSGAWVSAYRNEADPETHRDLNYPPVQPSGPPGLTPEADGRLRRRLARLLKLINDSYSGDGPPLELDRMARVEKQVSRIRIELAVGVVSTSSDRRYRRYASRMILSRCETRWGRESLVPGGLPDADVGSRRWTPPQAVEVEDLVDGQEPLQAAVYPHPPSPSALAIFRIGAYRGRGNAERATRSQRRGKPGVSRVIQK